MKFRSLPFLLIARRWLPLACLACLYFLPLASKARGESATQAEPACTPAAKVAAEVQEVAPGIFVRQGAISLAAKENSGGIANVGFVIGDVSVAVIDTGGSWCDGARLRAAIKTRTHLPIRYVINTHMHPDHVLGNAAFAADAPEFIGHRRLGPALAARGDYYLRVNRDLVGEAAFGPTQIVGPTRTVSGKETIDLGGRRLELTAHPPGHTDNDLTVLDTATGTLWTGDLLFLGHIPVVDGRLLGWLRVLEDLQQVKAQRAVPGHGPVSVPWPDSLEPERTYLQRLATDLRRLIKQGADIRQAPEAAKEEAQNWELQESFHDRNATAGFAELEWEE